MKRKRRNPEVGSMETGIFTPKPGPVTFTGLAVGILLGLGILWFLKKKPAPGSLPSDYSRALPVSSDVPATASSPSQVTTIESCMASQPAPWINSPRKTEFLAYAKSKSSDPVWLKSDGCQWWLDFNQS